MVITMANGIWFLLVLPVLFTSCLPLSLHSLLGILGTIHITACWGHSNNEHSAFWMNKHQIGMETVMEVKLFLTWLFFCFVFLHSYHRSVERLFYPIFLPRQMYSCILIHTSEEHWVCKVIIQQKEQLGELELIKSLFCFLFYECGYRPPPFGEIFNGPHWKDNLCLLALNDFPLFLFLVLKKKIENCWWMKSLFTSDWIRKMKRM